MAKTTATSASCGQTITHSLTLDGDLACTGDGLILSGVDIVLNLNGHYISGNGASSSTGVRLTGRTETVRNGVVTFFGYGIQVEGTGDTVSAVRATRNGTIGINDHGQRTKLTNSVVYGGTGDGIYSLSSNSIYTGVHELSNAGSGVILGGGGQHDVTVTSNIANANGGYGIHDFGYGTTLTNNTADFNSRDGIYVDETTSVDGGGNRAKGNDYATGQTPRQCVNIVCS